MDIGLGARADHHEGSRKTDRRSSAYGQGEAVRTSQEAWVWTATAPREPRVEERLQFALESFIENGGEHRVKLGVGFGLGNY